MNRDDITRMAQEAGLEDGWSGWCQECGCDSEKLTRFAALVAAHEREQCAQLMDDMAAQDIYTNYYKVAALAIRKRNE